MKMQTASTRAKWQVVTTTSIGAFSFLLAVALWTLRGEFLGFPYFTAIEEGGDGGGLLAEFIVPIVIYALWTIGSLIVAYLYKAKVVNVDVVDQRDVVDVVDQRDVVVNVDVVDVVNQQMSWISETEYVLPPPPILPKMDPRDTHLHITNNIADAKKAIIALREDLQNKRYIFVQGKTMVEILRMLGATEADLSAFQGVCDNMNQDPHLPFRKTSMYRAMFDFKSGIMKRLRREPFVLSAKEGFNRKDSGLCRFFGEPQNWIMHNTAWQALMKFKVFMIDGVNDTRPRDGCDANRNWNHCGFFLRTITTSDLLGEPAAEGVHQDGVEWTMTTMIGSKNMRCDSAKSTLYSLDQAVGVAPHEADPQKVMDCVQHTEFLDTLLFVDNEMSHSVSPLFQVHSKQEARRDMGVFFTRRMAKIGGGFSAEAFDSETMHERLPFAMETKSPMLVNEYNS